MSRVIRGWEAGEKYQNLFKKFQTGLQLWCRTGKEPEAGNEDVRYYLDLQEKRRKEHDLEIKIKIEPEGAVYSSHNVTASIGIPGYHSLSKFNQSTYYQQINQETEYKRKDKTVYKKKVYHIQYQTIIDPEEGQENVGSISYLCPNCGSISTVNTLKEKGCPFCGTRYLMKDLFPKVTNFYCIDAGGMSNKQFSNMKRNLFIGGIIVSSINTGLNYFIKGDLTLAYALVMLILGVPLFMFFLYFIYSIFLLFRLILKAGKALTFVSWISGSKKLITKTLKKYDPSFDYEYFEGKALALARIIMFSKEPQEFVQYEGPDISRKFEDVIDMKYRGGFSISSIQKKEDKIKVSLKLFLTNTIDTGDQLKDKDQTVKIDMYHHIEFPIDKAFSILKVECPSCGGSFDAGKQKYCPYCKRKFDAGMKDWIVTRIERK